MSGIELGLGEGGGAGEETIHLTLFKRKYNPKSVSFNVYGCARNCVWCTFFKITIIIL